MITISRRFLNYICVLSGKSVAHYVLIACVEGKMIMLSHANLYLRDISASKDTSNKYSNAISMFYRYLSTLEKFKSVPLAGYHSIVDNQDLKNWQIQRQVDRVAKQSSKPCTETIINDGKLIYSFLAWLDTAGYSTCMSFKYKTWEPDFKNEDLLSHIKRKALLVLDGRGIKALDRDIQQDKAYTLPSDYELECLILGYHDPVYAALFKLSLGTAMRPLDLCNFPYIGNGFNSHIMPYENMEFNDDVVTYYIADSKGGKSREVSIHRLDLKALDDHYIKDHYGPRAALYQKRFGVPCPPSVLFLSSRGIPVTPKMISRRTFDARDAARRLDPSIRASVRFYDSRHWWPTMFLIKRFQKALLGELSQVRDFAAMQVLKNQMGHSKLITTYNHYVDVARVILLSHEGIVNELVKNPSQTVSQFLKSPSLD